MRLLDVAALTKFDVRAGFAALERVQDQKANFEEEAVWGHVETAHFVETITAYHQCNEPYSFTQHLDVVHYPVDSCLKDRRNTTTCQHTAVEGSMCFYSVFTEHCLSQATYQTHCSSNTLSPPSPSCTRSCRRHHV